MTGRMKPIRLLSALFVLGGTLVLINCPSPLFDAISQRNAQANAGVNPFASFSFTSALNSATGVSIDCIGQVAGANIEVTVPYGTTVTGLKATFTTTTAGTVTIGTTTQTSGTTANDFTSPVQYTLKVADGRTYAGTVTVTVAPSGVTLSQTIMTLAAGGPTGLLLASVTPTNVSNTNLVWSSSAIDIATVSPSGLINRAVVTPIAVGTATITATTADGTKSASCLVTVTTPVAVTAVALSQTTASVAVGASTYLSVFFTPSNATNQLVTWSSSDSSIATVSGGQVTGEAIGYAVITAKTADGGKIATCLVTVTAPIAVTGVTVSPSTLTLSVGGAAGTLTGTITPANATNKKVTWSSSNTSIASVSFYGQVTGLAVGIATITATTVDGSFTATCSVTVTAPIAVTSVTLSQSTLNLAVGGSDGYLNTIIAPANASKPSVTWSTSNAAVATITQSWSTGAYIAGLSAGGATITATTVDGSNKTATCSVTVTAPIAVTGVTLSRSTLNLAVGGSEGYLYTSIAPSNATNPGVTWSTSDASVATISNSWSTGAYITGLSAGNATITATTVDGSNKTATCAVAVTASVAVTGVTLNNSSITLAVGGNTWYMYPTITPPNATNRGVTWSTSNAAVAGFSDSWSTGAEIAGLSVGTATITATTVDGSKTAFCLVTVNAPIAVTGVTVTPSTLNQAVGASSDLSYSIAPANATNKNVTWSSSNTAVALVSSSGQVTSRATGIATITTKTVDGGFTANCSVTVP